MNDEVNAEFFEKEGYEQVKLVNGMWCGLQRFIFTYGLCINMDSVGMSGRFCFDSKLSAELFFKDWDGKTSPEVGIDGCTAVKCDLEGTLKRVEMRRRIYDV